MKLGVALPSFASDDCRLTARQLERFATRAEEYGFAGLWELEHLVQPPTYRTSWLDPLTTLATVAGATETIPIGTSILILPMRNPVLVAQRAATVQHLSEGRLTLGLGLGYVEAEYDAVNVPFAERSPRFSEGIELLYRLLHGDRVTFDGEFYEVTEFTLEPNVRPPRVLAGGASVETDGERHVPSPVVERIGEVDGWVAPSGSPELREQDWSTIAESLEARGRRPEEFDRVALNYTHLVPGVDTETALEKQRTVFEEYITGSRGSAADLHLLGSVDDVRDQLAAYEDAGFDQVILGPPTYDPSEVERQLRLWRDELLPGFE